jgi:hypothetical protein
MPGATAGLLFSKRFAKPFSGGIRGSADRQVQLGTTLGPKKRDIGPVR